MNAKKQTMKLFGKLAAVAAVAFATQANAQLFISETVEGSGNNKCIEIQACQTTALAGWIYQAYHNGNGTVTYSIDLGAFASLNLLPDTLVAGQVIAICNPGAQFELAVDGGSADLFSGSIQHNGNDAHALFNSTLNCFSDVFGDINSTSNFNRNNSWRRNAAIVSATSLPGSNSTANWTAAGNNNLSGIGTPVASVTGCPVCSSQLCSEQDNGSDCILITGYLEGSFSNKCVEITNPGCDTVCLANYQYRAYHNGANVFAPTYFRNLGDFQDFLLPGETMTICNTNADSAVLAAINTTSIAAGNDSVYLWNNILHNGNDALAIYNFQSTAFCDIFGNIGEDSTWLGICGLDTHRTFNTNLTRNTTICTGVTTDPADGTGFPTICSQWSQDTNLNSTANLGSQDVSFCQTFVFQCGGGKRGDVKGAINATGLNVYPNPAQNTATFEFTAAADENAVLEVFTISGVKVAQPFNGTVQEGVTYREDLDVTGLPAGTYIYRYTAGADSKVGRISVIK